METASSSEWRVISQCQQVVHFQAQGNLSLGVYSLADTAKGKMNVPTSATNILENFPQAESTEKGTL